MGLLDPTPPPYDPLEWERKPFAERAKLSCQAWALQGYGTPLPVVFAYVLKVGAYIGGWLWFCSFTPGLGQLDTISQWWLHPIAFQKAIVWSLLFEIMGFGCGSGPLTARYIPPMGGCLYFLRPGTTSGVPPGAQISTSGTPSSSAVPKCESKVARREGRRSSG